MQVQLDELMSQIEDRVASAVQRGLERGLSGISTLERAATTGTVRVARAARVLAGGEPCAATHCRKAARTKGLCAAHYQKALRLKMRGPAYSQEQRDELGADGRALRFKKGRK